MRILPKNVRKFQEGGPMPSEDPAMAGEAPMEEMPAESPAPQGGEDPIMMLAQMAAQALQTQDPNAAFQVCQGLLQLLQQAQQQQAGGPEGQGEPVFRRGGKLAYRLKK